MTKVASTEMQNNFGKYLSMVQEGEEIIVTKNGTEVARLVSNDTKCAFLTQSIRGILNGEDFCSEDIWEEKVKKYENHG